MILDFLFNLFKKRKEKAYLLVFSADWCRPARLLEQALKNAGINFTSIECEKEDDLSEQFQIMNIPTTILIDSRENMIQKWHGYDENDPKLNEIVDAAKKYNILKYKYVSHTEQNKNKLADVHSEKPLTSTNKYNAEFCLPKIEECSIHQSYDLNKIRRIPMGGDLELAPYDAWWFIEASDADVLPILIKSSPNVIKYLPGMDFSSTEACKKTLKGYCLQTEAGLGWTYVIRNTRFPAGMIFVHSPKYNEHAMNLKIWTIDFFILSILEHKNVMFQSLLRVFCTLKKDFGVKKVYAVVDPSNAACLNLLFNANDPLFSEVDNTGFKDATHPGNMPRVFMLDLSSINFEHR